MKPLMCKSRTNYIKLDKCRHGYLYRLRSRNLSFGIYNKDNKGFIGIRTKFGSKFLDTEYHWDTGAPYGTACPQIEVGKCPVEDFLDKEKNYLKVYDYLASFNPHDYPYEV